MAIHNGEFKQFLYRLYKQIFYFSLIDSRFKRIFWEIPAVFSHTTLPMSAGYAISQIYSFFAPSWLRKPQSNIKPGYYFHKSQRPGIIDVKLPNTTEVLVLNDCFRIGEICKRILQQHLCSAIEENKFGLLVCWFLEMLFNFPSLIARVTKFDMIFQKSR